MKYKLDWYDKLMLFGIMPFFLMCLVLLAVLQ